MDLGSNLAPNVYGGNCCAIQGILEQMDFLKIVFQLEQPFQGACKVEHWQRVERFFSEVDDLILDQEWVGPKIDFDKGQLISKSLFCIFNSPKKRTKKFYFTTMVPRRIVFVRFLGELKTPKRHFEINWPLERKLFFLIKSKMRLHKMLTAIWVIVPHVHVV